MAMIETFVEPRYLYRYRSIETTRQFERELDALRNNYLWFSNFEDLNDPMEGLFRSSRALRAHPDYSRVLDDILNRKLSIGICSFSEVYNHELMWAHYANQFRGICVAYNVTKMLHALPTRTRLVRLFYNEEEPMLLRNATRDRNAAMSVLSNKNHRWLYEREWRALSFQQGHIDLTTECIARVYFGSRIRNDHKRRIVKVLDRMGIKHLSMAIDGYFVSFEAD